MVLETDKTYLTRYIKYQRKEDAVMQNDNDNNFLLFLLCLQRNMHLTCWQLLTAGWRMLFGHFAFVIRTFWHLAFSQSKPISQKHSHLETFSRKKNNYIRQWQFKIIGKIIDITFHEVYMKQRKGEQNRESKGEKNINQEK